MAMTRNDRDRHHRAQIAQIEAVQVVAGTGDRARVNHERTLLERARLLGEEYAAHTATERGLEALARLLQATEERGSRDRRHIAPFVEAIWNNKPLPLAALRSVDKRTADDMLDVLDAWRYARVNLVENVAGGPRRLAQAIKACRTSA